MPIKILKELGWDFDDKSEYRTTKEKMRAIYSTKPGERIGMWQTLKFQQSREKGEDSTVERTAKNLQRRIIENLNRMKDSIEDAHEVLAVPADWGVGPISFGNVLLVEHSP